jgi:cytochrome c oxidase assembly protein subunit 15
MTPAPTHHVRSSESPALATGSATYQPWLHRYNCAVVIVSFCLITLGGTVTSKGVGMAVPDWPTTFNYNMFLFPPSMWKGGIFWEHSHRLLGSLVGFLSIISATWLWLSQRPRPWLRQAGLALLAVVIAQGIMGGLRVTQNSITWATIHGINGQLFLCLTVLIAAATSRWWIEHEPQNTIDSQGTLSPDASRRLRIGSLLLLATLVVQLSLGAGMRHTGSGLAIPDFPSSFGSVVPPFDREAIAAYEAQLPYDTQRPLFTPAQVGVNFAHRCWAIVVVLAATTLLVLIIRSKGVTPRIAQPAFALGTLLLVQVCLGAFVVWSGRHPEIATAHQTTGAATLATAALLSIRLHRLTTPAMIAAANPASPMSSSAPLTASLRGAGA